MTRTSLVLFTRDLRVHDNPTLDAAATAERVLAVFVLDERILASDFHCPNRGAFLAESLRDLDANLRELGAAGLVVRRGDPVAETAALAAQVEAQEVHLSRDWSAYARDRERRMDSQLRADGRRLVVHDATVAVVPPGEVVPQGKDHFAVFTPYHRRWEDVERRTPLRPPGRLRSPRVRKGRVPGPAALSGSEHVGGLPEGGESAGRRRLAEWLEGSVEEYGDRNDDLAADATSHLSSYLHFGCLSPVEVIARAGDSPGAQAFVRQLAWRDFHLQVLAARPDTARRDYRHRADSWRSGGRDFAAWCAGETGVPIVDAAMRQLAREGWMHNRGRLIAASFLTKHLYIDWREGARHFLRHLVDGDLAQNQLNWQWVAGTGTDTRPNRVLNPIRQAERFDPDGAYVRRYVDELATVESRWIHRPWRLPADGRAELDYPDPIVDLDDAAYVPRHPQRSDSAVTSGARDMAWPPPTNPDVRMRRTQDTSARVRSTSEEG